LGAAFNVREEECDGSTGLFVHNPTPVSDRHMKSIMKYRNYYLILQ